MILQWRTIYLNLFPSLLLVVDGAQYKEFGWTDAARTNDDRGH
jgi:hypothetical protein